VSQVLVALEPLAGRGVGLDLHRPFRQHAQHLFGRLRQSLFDMTEISLRVLLHGHQARLQIGAPSAHFGVGPLSLGQGHRRGFGGGLGHNLLSQAFGLLGWDQLSMELGLAAADVGATDLAAGLLSRGHGAVGGDRLGDWD